MNSLNSLSNINNSFKNPIIIDSSVDLKLVPKIFNKYKEKFKNFRMFLTKQMKIRLQNTYEKGCLQLGLHKTSDLLFGFFLLQRHCLHSSNPVVIDFRLMV